jgi:transcriptional pleiotropic regulator of transition state genes
MKATGIVRKLDQLGRVVLPMELRRTLDISEGTPFEISVEEDTIVLHKYKPGCCLCGSEDNLLHIGDKLICRACAEKIAVGLSAETQGSGEAGTGEASEEVADCETCLHQGFPADRPPCMECDGDNWERRDQRKAKEASHAE